MVKSSKTRVNIWCADTIFDPLGGLADSDEGLKYVGLNANDEGEVKSLVRNELAPHLASFSEDEREATSLAFQYLLSFHTERLEDVFQGCLLPFESPDDLGLFFTWAWEALYPDRPFQLDNAEDYVAIYSPNDHLAR